jgi:hypothetical protein
MTDLTDLVKRLRAVSNLLPGQGQDAVAALCLEASDELEDVDLQRRKAEARARCERAGHLLAKWLKVPFGDFERGVVVNCGSIEIEPGAIAKLLAALEMRDGEKTCTTR